MCSSLMTSVLEDTKVRDGHMVLGGLFLEVIEIHEFEYADDIATPTRPPASTNTQQENTIQHTRYSFTHTLTAVSDRRATGTALCLSSHHTSPHAMITGITRDTFYTSSCSSCSHRHRPPAPPSPPSSSPLAAAWPPPAAATAAATGTATACPALSPQPHGRRRRRRVAAGRWPP